MKATKTNKQKQQQQQKGNPQRKILESRIPILYYRKCPAEPSGKPSKKFMRYQRIKTDAH